MSRINRMRTGTKIVAAFALTAALLVGLLALNVSSLGTLRAASATFVSVRVPDLESLAGLDQGLTDVSRAIHALSNARFDAADRSALFADAEREPSRQNPVTSRHRHERGAT